MTVFENVAFGLRMQKVPSSEIEPRVMEARMVALIKFTPRNLINYRIDPTTTCCDCTRSC